MEKEFTILGFVGSLRQGSFNKALMQTAQEQLPDGVTLTVADIGSLPLFSEDLEKDPPEAVRTLKQQIEAADAILFATPEYNYSIPGVLKNAIDWGSRPYGANSFDGKPVAVMGASVGAHGTARAQYHLRQCFVFLNMLAVNRPEVQVPTAQEKVDAEGRITDEFTRKKVAELVEALVAWARRING